MAFSTQRKLFTIQDYHKMADAGIIKPDDQVELIKGEIIQMTPINSVHAGIVNFLIEYLVLELHTKYTIIAQNPIQLNSFSEPEPDIVLAAYREDKYRSGHPTPADIYLIIEVADSSLEYDRSVKKKLYSEAGIPEYWIVNISHRQLEIFREPSDSEYQYQEVLRDEETADCLAVDFFLPLKALFDGV